MFPLFGPFVLCLLLVLLPGCLVDPVCYDDADCPDGAACDTPQGRCVTPRAKCSDPGDCAAGFHCDAGHCVPDTTEPLGVTPRAECFGPGDCTAGFHCDAGHCVPDATEPLVCPEGMVCVGDAYCIDQYEASRPDATADAMGKDTSRAVSCAGVIPWYQNPLSRATLNQFAAACRRAGKHLCTRDEWYAACAGSAESIYVFGDIFNRETCNCVDTFCDDYCQQNGITNCILNPDCGYGYGSFHIALTGSFPECVDEYGAFDINGNVWEVVTSDRDDRGYEVRGGAFNCADASERLQCTYNARWDQLYAGFRCCWRPEADAAP